MASDPLAFSEALEFFKSCLDPGDIIYPHESNFAAETTPWAAQKDERPRLVIQPKTADDLAKCLSHLAATTLDFAVRGQGYGSSSANDVIISLRHFNNFDFDAENEVVTLGSGTTWGHYYQRMEEAAPDYSVVACRYLVIGVGGSILSGGFSWLGTEYGCTSDPQNMLDAQVVKLDGSVGWASEEPELLWALRGAGASFGVVTMFKLRAYKYPRQVWAGAVLLPKASLPKVAKGIETFSRRATDPKISMITTATRDKLIVIAFDALGEEHGRSEKGFAWLLGLQGAINTAKVTTLGELANGQAKAAADAKGLTASYSTAFMVSTMTEDIVLRAVEWYEKTFAAPGSVGNTGQLLLEVNSVAPLKSSPTDAAWPRPADLRHIIRLKAGCSPSTAEEEFRWAQALIKNAPEDILGRESPFASYQTQWKTSTRRKPSSAAIIIRSFGS